MSTTQYGIGVTRNRFELFGIDDEDPLEVLKFHELEKEARKKTKLSEKENKGKGAVTAKPKTTASRKGIKETQNLKTHENVKAKDDNKSVNVTQRSYERNERKFVGDNREDRNNRRNRSDADFQREERGAERLERKDMRGNISGTGPVSHELNEGGTAGRGGMQRGGRIGGGARGGGPSGGGPRGGTGGSVRGGRGGGVQGANRATPSFDSKGKREYDRQLVTDKSEVNGTATQEDSNWQTDKQDSETVVDTNGAVTTTDVEEGANLEEERKELTLDEWKALKAPRQKPTYNLRKAGEGEDLSQWKKMYALQKKKDGEEDEDEDEYEYESCEYPQRVGRQKHILDIDIHFKDTRSGGRARGGRGGGRGGPRLGGRPGQPGTITSEYSEKHAVRGRDTKSAPKVDDEHDFPSLG